MKLESQIIKGIFDWDEACGIAYNELSLELKK